MRKKYKLVNEEHYSILKLGKIYDENHIASENSSSVRDLVKNYPDDWEEINELTFPREMMVRTSHGNWEKQKVFGIFPERESRNKVVCSTGVYPFAKELSDMEIIIDGKKVSREDALKLLK